MKRVTAFPFRRAAANRVQPSVWMNESGIEAFPDLVFRTWDPGTDLKLKRTFEIDVGQLVADCGLGRRAALRLTCGWVSDGTSVRETPVRVDFTASDTKLSREIEMTVPGRFLRSEVALRTCIVLLKKDSRDPLAATQPGSRLWSDEIKILLEG